MQKIRNNVYLLNGDHTLTVLRACAAGHVEESFAVVYEDAHGDTSIHLMTKDQILGKMRGNEDLNDFNISEALDQVVNKNRIAIKTLNDLAAVVYKNAVDHGFYENDLSTNIGERLALIHAEVSEALEAERKDRYLNIFDISKTGVGLYELMGYGNDSSFVKAFKSYIKGTFEEEMADIIIRVLDMCAFKNIDIDAVLDLKMRYNSLREFRHGKKY